MSLLVICKVSKFVASNVPYSISRFNRDWANLFSLRGIDMYLLLVWLSGFVSGVLALIWLSQYLKNKFNL